VAMRANPIGLIITAILAVAAGLVLAYKRSETFRRIVQTVFRAVAAYVSAYIDLLKRVWEFFTRTLPAAVRALADRLGDAWDWIKDKAGAAWDWISDKVRRVIDTIRGHVATIRDAVARAGAAVRDRLGDAWDWVMDKVQPVVDAVQWIVDKLGSLDFPDIPGFGRAAATPATTTTDTTATAGDTYNITVEPGAVTGVYTETQAGDALVQVLDRWVRARGGTPVFTS
jgi:hypothetical protein